MGVHNKPLEENQEMYFNAGRVRKVLSDGKARSVGEIARELGLTYAVVNNSLTALTSIEPLLAQDDDDSLFIATGG